MQTADAPANGKPELITTRPQLPVDNWRNKLPPQKRIAIIGKAPDTLKLAPWNDPSWQIWILNDMASAGEASRWDACFEVHDYVFEQDTPHRRWLTTAHGKPIFLPSQRADVPDCVPLPLDEITGSFGRYFTNTVSWMLAVAVLARPEEIGIWGVNMAQDGEYAHQRPSVEFFAGIAVGSGIKLTIPKASDLLKCGSLYGVENSPILTKMSVRRQELQQRLGQARANENHWTAERMHVEGMLGELTYWDMYAGASQ